MGPDDTPQHLTPRERWELVRDVVLFALGAAGFCFELITGRGLAERPILLGLSGAMMGVGKVLELLSGKSGRSQP